MAFIYHESTHSLYEDGPLLLTFLLNSVAGSAISIFAGLTTEEIAELVQRRINDQLNAHGQTNPSLTVTIEAVDWNNWSNMVSSIKNQLILFFFLVSIIFVTIACGNQRYTYENRSSRPIDIISIGFTEVPEVGDAWTFNCAVCNLEPGATARTRGFSTSANSPKERLHSFVARYSDENVVAYSEKLTYEQGQQIEWRIVIDLD